MLQERVEAIERQRRVEIGEPAADIDATGDGFDERGRIDRRFEQRQLPHDALDVHAVSNLEQPIGDRVPICQHVVVLRQTEVERLRQLGKLTYCPGSRAEQLSKRQTSFTIDLDV